MYDMSALYQAESVQDAIRLRLEHPEAQIIAGGTDVLVQMREGKRAGVELISLIAPTSKDRIAMIAREAEGFLYVVSSLGVTGARSEIKTDLASMMETVRQNTHIPAAIGFGISTPEQAKRMAELADGVIVGSAIVKLLEQHGKDAPGCIGAYVKTMKDAIR